MWETIKTPAYVVDEKKLRENLECLHRVEEETGCHILLAQKAFSMFRVYPLIGSYLSGTTASGLYEARLGYEEMKKENHVFAPAYKTEDMKELVTICDHIIFNSFAQFEKHKEIISEYNNSQRENGNRVSIGMRVNPEFSTQEGHAIYDPCAPGSRLGVVRAKFPETLPKEIEGLHVHTLCEQDSDDLEATFNAFEKSFEPYLKKIKWLNLGGGHHITRPGYDIERLIRLIKRIKDTYHLEVYLEPGEAIALNAGYLITEVQDIVDNDLSILILDASAACHMPDVLEMPYTPPLRGGLKISDMEDEYGIDKDIEIDFDMDVKEGIWKPAKNGRYRYRLSSYTCLAGDIIGDYQFGREINVGDRLVFEDMAIYSMVKNNTFNGIPLPDIVIMDSDGECKVWKHFGYEDFKGRL